MKKAVFSDSLNVTLFNQNSFTDVNEKEVGPMSLVVYREK